MIISIDIGTSYSSICYKNKNGEILPVDTATGVCMFGSKHSLPSAVFVDDVGKLLIGQAALNSRRINPANFCMEFKRELGTLNPYCLGEKQYLPEQIYKEFFLYMGQKVRQLSDEEIEEVHLTYPVAFSETKKELIKSAAEKAGFTNLVLVDEPTAAAISYCQKGQIQDGQTVLIYDFGGGTFDVSLIEYKNGEYNVIAVGGIELCGGSDIDRIIFEDLMVEIEKNFGAEFLENLNKNPMHRLKFESQVSETVVKIKHQLSDSEKVEEYISFNFEGFTYVLTRERFNSMIAKLIDSTILECKQVLTNSNTNVQDLSAVLLVGGSSRIPLIYDMLKNLICAGNVFRSDDLELIVAQGAVQYTKEPLAVAVPNINDLTQAQAKIALELASLNLGNVSKEYNGFVDNGKVINYSNSGEKVKKGTLIDVVISKGVKPQETIAVPNINDLTQAQAKIALELASLNLGIVSEEYNAFVPAGKVISYLNSDQKVKKGTLIDVIISKGVKPQETVAVPNINALTQAQAKMTLESASLGLGVVSEEFNNSVAAGKVISYLNSGKKVEIGTLIDVVISKGVKPPEFVVVPKIIGLSLEKAKAALEAGGLTLGMVTKEHSTSVENGVVMSYINRGEKVKKGSSIDVIVSMNDIKMRFEQVASAQTRQNGYRNLFEYENYFYFVVDTAIGLLKVKSSTLKRIHVTGGAEMEIAPYPKKYAAAIFEAIAADNTLIFTGIYPVKREVKKSKVFDTCEGVFVIDLDCINEVRQIFTVVVSSFVKNQNIKRFPICYQNNYLYFAVEKSDSLLAGLKKRVHRIDYKIKIDGTNLTQEDEVKLG